MPAEVTDRQTELGGVSWEKGGIDDGGDWSRDSRSIASKDRHTHLVVLVVVLFLANTRASIITLLAIPLGWAIGITVVFAILTTRKFAKSTSG